MGGRSGGTARKILATMWECAGCQYANFRRAAECRLCGRVRVHGSLLVQQWWIAANLPVGWDQEPRRPLARRGGMGGDGRGNGSGHGGDDLGSGGRRGGSGGPTGAGGSRPMVLRRGEGNASDTCPTRSLLRRDSQRQGHGEGVERGMATRNRWNAPPRNRPEDGRLGAPGALDSARGRGADGGMEAAGELGGGDGWQEGLNKVQRKRIRQRARRRQEASGKVGGECGREDHNEDTEEEEEEDADADDQETPEPVRPYQPPPLPRLLCAQQAEQLRKKLEKMQQEGSRPQLLQRAERRLEEARRMVREAGGPTERRLVFSILQEETKERKLRESLPKADQEVEEKAAQVREAQRALEEAKKRNIDLEARWRNSKARVAFLAAEKAAETLPHEQTSAVHEALQTLLVSVPPAMQAQARVVSEYFRAVAPLPARLPEDTFYERSDGDTQDEGQAMEGIDENGKQGTKRCLQEAQMGSASLPTPARSVGSLEEARVQLAQIRHQKLAAISAAFDRGSSSPEHVPLLAPAELADCYDRELQRALEQVKAYAAAEAEEQEPTPCVHSAAKAAVETASNGAADQGEKVGEESGRGGKTARVQGPSSSEEGGADQGAAAAGKGEAEEPRGETSGGQPTRTKWEQAPQDSVCEAGSGARPQLSRTDRECPGCGRLPMSREALQGQCECGAAVCLDCAEGGVAINSCLVCFDRCEEAEADGDAEEWKEAPGPMAFAGTLSGEVQGRNTTRRATPY